MKKEYIIPIFVPHLGCPHTCTFCNQKEISGQTKQVTEKDVKETINYYLKNFKDNSKYVEVAFFGGSFTGIEEKVQKKEKQKLSEVLGDIVISVPQVEKQAIEYGHSFERELSYMVVHGFYHLMGYDHIEEEDKKKMRPKEETILTKLHITRE